ncbi:MAG: hypothetical protein ABSB23_07820 [Bryobacteraceae bacterium]
MGPIPPVSLPPVTAEYTSALQPPKPNGAPVQSSYRFSRSADGKTRVDSGNTSVISNPTAGQTVLLDHLKKTATIVPPAAPQMSGSPPPQMPQSPHPGMPAAPAAPAMQVQDLGKSLFKGHEVEGKRYVIQPPPPMPGTPKAPPPPGMPKPPQMPGMKAPQLTGVPAPPKAPGVAGAPPPPTLTTPPKPQTPTTVDTWTSPSLHLPMATKMTGSFGQITQMCHTAVPGEPHPAAFQIPPGYKVINPAPKPPAPPKPPAMPKL